jgi:hypothetical protein
MWDILDIQLIDLMDPLGNPMNNVLLSLKRKVKSYLYTIPSYIVYTMTLIMFLLPQTSSQRVVIGMFLYRIKFFLVILFHFKGSTCLVMMTMLTYMLSNSLPHNDISAWPLLGNSLILV